MSPSVTPFLMFQGTAQEAIEHYVSLFEDGRIDSITHHGAEGPGEEGSVMYATFTLAGQQFAAIDSAVEHDFDFTPSLSLFVQCDSEEQIRSLYDALLQGGEDLMELGDHGFSTLFAWIDDRWGVSWQLNYDAPESAATDEGDHEPVDDDEGFED